MVKGLKQDKKINYLICVQKQRTNYYPCWRNVRINTLKKQMTAQRLLDDNAFSIIYNIIESPVLAGKKRTNSYHPHFLKF